MGVWESDGRMDFYNILDEKVKSNTDCVAAIVKKDNLIDNKGLSTLKVKNYGKAFNLCVSEPFYEQSISIGPLVTGFLVKDDVIATTANFVVESNVTDLRIVFGYKMLNNSTQVITLPNGRIYKGVQIIQRVYNRTHKGDRSNWALIKLDRKVEGQTIARLSKENIFLNQPVYVLGYPCGLPLKYAGATVHGVYKTYFAAGLDVYIGNSGSPVFDSDTHEVIGMVVHGYSKDFRWTGRGWISVIYPNAEIASEESQCTITMVSTFIDIVDQL
jgi:hypothetical protein